VVDVDRSADISLEALAAGRDITICFTDLDGADGLWLPEERTIMLALGLSKRRAAEVLQHELSHVDIEDGHAALDAAVHRHVGRIRWTVATTAAASIALLVGFKASQSHPQKIADSRSVQVGASVPSQTGHPSQRPVVRAPSSTKVIRISGVRTETVTVTPSAASTPLSTPDTSASASTTASGPAGTASGTQPSTPSTPNTPTTPVVVSTTQKVTPSSSEPTQTSTPPVDTTATNPGGLDSSSPSLVASSNP
jgi:hypothetical protein